MNLKCLNVLAVGLAGVVALGACGGGSDAGSSGLARGRTAKTSTTTAASVSSTTTTGPAVSPTTTARPPVTATTTTTTPSGRFVDGVPQVTASPRSGVAGDRIHIEGHGFTEQNWKEPTARLWLAGSAPGCALYAAAAHTVTVSASGLLSGEFIVPAEGECRQSDVPEAPVRAGAYRIVFQCTACTIGELEVAADPPGPAYCSDVVFSPNSENGASSIRATGLSCVQAEALVRKVGGPLGPINGAPTADADGFHCVRTSQSDVGLPTSTYECTNGAERVTFVRT